MLLRHTRRTFATWTSARERASDLGKDARAVVCPMLKAQRPERALYPMLACSNVLSRLAERASARLIEPREIAAKRALIGLFRGQRERKREREQERGEREREKERGENTTPGRNSQNEFRRRLRAI